jgi:hypothetical protein
MKRSQLLLVLAVAVVAWAGGLGGCTIVVPGGQDAMLVPVPVPTPPPTPPKVPAHALFVVNLHQSSANLAYYYDSIIRTLVGQLDVLGVSVLRWAITPTYPSTRSDVPVLVYGESMTAASAAGAATGATGTTSQPLSAAQDGGATGARPALPNPDASFDAGLPTQPPQLPVILQQLAASGLFDGTPTTAEGGGLVSLGAALGQARLPAELDGLDSQDFFDRPTSLFIVVYLQPLARKCGLSDATCQVNGRSAADIFTEVGSDGLASWLQYSGGGMPIANIVHVAIATKEGETVDAFRARCGAVTGFPRALFDVMEPSPVSYYEPLVTALNAAHPGTGQRADLCALLGADGTGLLANLAGQIAAMAGPPGK